MGISRQLSRLGRPLLLATTLVSVSAATAVGHTQTVTPKGNGEGFTKPISRSWAQAHCNAASPAHIADSSKGVVQFLPAAALPCPATPNPGGQVHPHAGD